MYIYKTIVLLSLFIIWDCKLYKKLRCKIASLLVIFTLKYGEQNYKKVSVLDGIG